MPSDNDTDSDSSAPQLVDDDANRLSDDEEFPISEDEDDLEIDEEGDDDDDDEEMSEDEGEQEASEDDEDIEEEVVGGMKGWAGSMAKVLKSDKSGVLSKAKKVKDVAKKKEKKAYEFEIEGEVKPEVDEKKPDQTALERALEKRKYRERREVSSNPLSILLVLEIYYSSIILLF